MNHKLAFSALVLVSGVAATQAQRRFNPVVELLAQHKPVFGVYAPRNPRAGRGGAPPEATQQAVKTPAQLAKDALEYKAADYIFDGSMEGEFDARCRVHRIHEGAGRRWCRRSSPSPRLHHPVIVKTHEIAPDPALAAQRIARQLDLGVSGIVFVGVESADEVKAGLAAMRFKSSGGTRPDDVGVAPSVLGHERSRNTRRRPTFGRSIPNGELTNWTIVESKEGLKHVREIAAVKGIGCCSPARVRCAAC